MVLSGTALSANVKMVSFRYGWNIVGIDAEQKIAIANVMSVHKILKFRKKIILLTNNHFNQHKNLLTVRTKFFPHLRHISFA